jgi:predicted ATPase
MTVVENEHGQQNVFAKEPKMYVSDSDAERYALETHAERAEKLNSMYAMLGVIAGFVSYAFTGKLFFGLY